MKTRQVIKVSEYKRQFEVIHDETAKWGPYFVYKKEIRWDGERPHKTKRIIARLDSIEDCLEYLAEYNEF